MSEKICGKRDLEDKVCVMPHDHSGSCETNRGETLQFKAKVGI